MLAALECLPRGGALHVYGFNWSPDNAPVHSMGAERAFIQAMAGLLGGRLRLHHPPCEDRFSCGGS